MFSKLKVGFFVYKKSNFPSTKFGLIDTFFQKNQVYSTRIYNENIYLFNFFKNFSKSLLGPISTINRTIVQPFTVTRPVRLIPKDKNLELKKNIDYWLTLNPKDKSNKFLQGKKLSKLYFSGDNNEQIEFTVSNDAFTKYKSSKNVKVSNQDESIFVSEFPNSSGKITHIHYIFIDTLFYFSKNNNTLLNDCFKELNEIKIGKIIFENHYSSSDWTMPSIASMLTGLPVHIHGMTNPGSNNSKQDEEDSLHENILNIFEISEINGFFNTVVSANPRLNPLYGYSRGTHQFFYKPYMPHEQILTLSKSEARSHSNKNSVFFLALMDLHHQLGGKNFELIDQQFFSLAQKDSKTKAELIGRDDSTQFFRTEYYLIAKLLARNVSNYIKEVNSQAVNVENIFIITSDHSGVPSPKSQISGKKLTGRFHVPCIVMSNSFPKSDRKVHELIEGANFASILISNFKKNKFLLSRFRNELINHKIKKEFVLCEIIYPNQNYRAQLITKKYVFFIETSERVIGRTIDFNNYMVETYDRLHDEYIPNNDDTLRFLHKFFEEFKSSSTFTLKNVPVFKTLG